MPKLGVFLKNLPLMSVVILMFAVPASVFVNVALIWTIGSVSSIPITLAVTVPSILVSRPVPHAEHSPASTVVWFLVQLLATVIMLTYQ